MDLNLKEIFVSYQAEGFYIGEPTIFIRFFGCNLDCYYCDEKLSKLNTNRKVDIRKVLIDIKKLLKEKNIKFISLTGGEPLIQPNIGLLVEQLYKLKKKFKFKLYLETNASVANSLLKIIKYIDVISMDLKIPDDDKRNKNVLQEFKKCIDICKKSKKKFFVKLVVGGSSIYSLKTVKLIKSIIKKTNLSEIVLQPVTEELRKKNKSLFLNLCNLFASLKNILKNIYIIPQLHKTIWKIK
ncbi:MAG: 7-carboxy-7-deazaguanine synthase QueE [Endomicrobiia bacterium]